MSAPARIGGDDEVEVTSAGEIYSCVNGVVEDANTFKKFKFNTKWHMVVVVHDGRYDKGDVLDALATMLDGFDFYPCYYKTYSKQDEFFVINCYEALSHLIQAKLALRMKNTNELISVVLKMNVADFKEGQVVVEEKLNNCLVDRFNDRCLDLCSLQQHLDKIKFVDFTARSTRTLSRILSIAGKKFGPVCLVIRLRNNGLKNLQALSALFGFPKLMSLDLRYNEVRYCAALYSKIIFALGNRPSSGAVQRQIALEKQLTLAAPAPVATQLEVIHFGAHLCARKQRIAARGVARVDAVLARSVHVTLAKEAGLWGRKCSNF